MHGREAYRRNAYLIAYMFYKNIIYVMPYFWFGIISMFSGLTFYNSMLYQCYNIFFTSLPIMWFAIYDLEYEKEEFLENYKLYKIGFQN